jgi:peptidoglycan glycosyltransferase
VSRRLGVLATIILLLFAVAATQAANIQFFKAPALDANPSNPRNNNSSTKFPRGQIDAADGSVLAFSTKQNSALYPYRRVYPDGSLFSGILGFSSPWYGVWGLEDEYNGYLAAHAQPPQSIEQVLAPTSAADSITLTVLPALQRVARAAMVNPDGSPEDGAAVVLNPKNGDVLAMYSNPSYNPVSLTSPNIPIDKAAWKLYTKEDSNGFAPLGLVATQQTFPPGSTFKVITTAAAVVSKPADLTKSFNSDRGACTTLPDTTSVLCNSGLSICGGDVSVMLPVSCDPGYALLGLDLGADYMAKAANSFGYNSVPPIDLPSTAPGTAPSYFPSAGSFSNDLPGLAKSAIGQQNVRATALQNALVAAAIGNGGVMMTPHFLNYVTSPDGTIIKRYKDSVWKTPLTKAQAAFIVPLMQKVVTYGTASGVGFLSQDDVAAKTGTAQTGNAKKNTDDWLIAFAPATDPTVAVAVVIPYHPTPNFGATIAGPVVKCLVEGALAIQSGKPATGTSTTCPV